MIVKWQFLAVRDAPSRWTGPEPLRCLDDPLNLVAEVELSKKEHNAGLEFYPVCADVVEHLVGYEMGGVAASIGFSFGQKGVDFRRHVRQAATRGQRCGRPR
jgi:hypothetical protein